MQAAGGSRRWACGLHNTGTNRSIDPSESQSERGSGRAPSSINITGQKPESTSGRAARRRVDLASFMYGESYLSGLLRQSYLIDQPANRRVATNDLHTVSRRRMAVPSRRGRLKNKSAALEFRSCPVVVPSSNRRTGDWRSRADVSGATQVCLEGSKSLPCSCGGAHLWCACSEATRCPARVLCLMVFNAAR